jgi:SAM-dependent methyltransferase
VSRDHWFEDLADHMGTAYDRYAHTKGTRQEIDHLVGALGLRPGTRVLDVGCGTGRHAFELAARGMVVHGVDISARFVEIARARIAGAGGDDGRDDEVGGVGDDGRDDEVGGVGDDGRDDDGRRRLTFERLDARALPFDAAFDAVVCLCQGAFGMMTAEGDDDLVVAGMARALRPGGRLALSAFNAYFAVRYHDGADFDAATGVSRERTEVRSESGETMTADLWTGCYTPRELRLLLDRHGLDVRSISSVEPGAYGSSPATTESPELLAIADKRRSLDG